MQRIGLAPPTIVTEPPTNTSTIKIPRSNGLKIVSTMLAHTRGQHVVWFLEGMVRRAEPKTRTRQCFLMPSLTLVTPENGVMVGYEASKIWYSGECRLNH
jgi:hypothetical protein